MNANYRDDRQMHKAANELLEYQPSLPGLSSVEEELNRHHTDGADDRARGAVFTRREVVDFILDLLRYTPDAPLHERRILEPSFGAGDFLLAVVERLLASWHRHDALADLGHSIRAVELHPASFEETRAAVLDLLTTRGIGARVATRLVDQWLIRGDFLLAPLPDNFDHVVGNPPYVRQERVPDALLAEYRTRYATIYDRADLYVPFIERSLNLLAPGGALGFICANRWTKNRYGRKLRQMVAERFHLRAWVDMVDTPAFHGEVIAYPAITIIAREPPGETRIARRPEIEANALRTLSRDLLTSTGKQGHQQNGSVRRVTGVVTGAEPWLLESPEELELVRRLERDFPCIEEAGCKVSIGVATGADGVFIGPYDELDVEPDRKLPLVTARDILSGEVEWYGLGLINPFADDHRGLVDLSRYPRLRAYLEAHRDRIGGRHVARKAPANWYRTIDRIHPALTHTPKLLIPDIKGKANIVFEEGRYYPHHNLYTIVSQDWDLRALQMVLSSGIARLFVAAYSTRMRGGYFRFQAQYLRRIRLPRWRDIPAGLKAELFQAAEHGDRAAGAEATASLYGLLREERAVLHIDGGGGWREPASRRVA